MKKPTNVAELIAYWDSGNGRPFQGTLMSISHLDEKHPGAENHAQSQRERFWDNIPPDDYLPCMCAQGQVLCTIGEVPLPRLARGYGQARADRDVAELLNISICHSILLRVVNDSKPDSPACVLTNPASVLGDNWSKVLDLWAWLDENKPQWRYVMGLENFNVGLDFITSRAYTTAQMCYGEACGQLSWTVAKGLRDISKFKLADNAGNPILTVDDIPTRPDDYGPQLGNSQDPDQGPSPDQSPDSNPA